MFKSRTSKPLTGWFFGALNLALFFASNSSLYKFVKIISSIAAGTPKNIIATEQKGDLTPF